MYEIRPEENYKVFNITTGKMKCHARVECGLPPAVYKVESTATPVCKIQVNRSAFEVWCVCILGSEEFEYADFQVGLSTQSAILGK